MKTIDHTADKKPSRPTFSNGCGGKNDVACSRLSADSDEDAKGKYTRKVGGAGKRKKEGRKKDTEKGKR